MRTTKRTNKDGSVVKYLQLAHNERDPKTGCPVAKVIDNFGREELVDKDALKRLMLCLAIRKCIVGDADEILDLRIRR